MNVETKKVKVLQCDRCPNTYMQVGPIIIGMAFPRPLTPDYFGEEKGKEHVCPAHPRRISS
jgi:hypothetical protein